MLQAALAATAEAMRADLAAQFAAEDRDEIVLPYVRDGKLPSDWTKRRIEAFRRHIRIRALEAAAKTARSLRTSFVAPAEDRLDETAITTRLHDVAGVVALVEGIRRSP